MPEGVLVDTDVLIDVARNIGAAVDCLAEIEQRSAAAVSTVTQMELIVGCRNQSELRKLDRFLARFQVVNLSEDIAHCAVQLLRRYRLSHGLLVADAIVAATAIVVDMPLVSKNQRDYRFIEELRLLPYPHPFAP